MFLTLNEVLAAMDGIEGWFSKQEAALLYDSALRGLHHAPIVVEIGSWHGRSTLVLGAAAQQRGSAEKVYAIDPHEGEIRSGTTLSPSYDAFLQNMRTAGLLDHVVPIRNRSFEVPWSAPIGLLFIDGIHTYDDVSRDYHHFERWLTPGAYVAFHDYSAGYPGVKRFVDELHVSGRLTFHDNVESLIVLQVSKVDRPT
jgi:predicted O-methyltransferase YrrM